MPARGKISMVMCAHLFFVHLLTHTHTHLDVWPLEVSACHAWSKITPRVCLHNQALCITIPLNKRSLCLHFTMSSSRATLHVFTINCPRDSGSEQQQSHSKDSYIFFAKLHNVKLKHNHYHHSMPGPTSTALT